MLCELPNQLVSRVASFLRPKELFKFICVCKRFASLVRNNENLWRKVCSREWQRLLQKKTESFFNGKNPNERIQALEAKVFPVGSLVQIQYQLQQQRQQQQNQVEQQEQNQMLSPRGGNILTQTQVGTGLEANQQNASFAAHVKGKGSQVYDVVHKCWPSNWKRFSVTDWIETIEIPWSWQSISRFFMNEKQENDEKDNFVGYRFLNNEIYLGEWNKNTWEGKGILFDFAHFRFCAGEWKEGTMDGDGTVIHEGRFYSGGWKKDKAHGEGTKCWAEGDWYKGQWHEGEQNGFGSYNWKSGSNYTGEWKLGEKNGKGVYAWHHGSTYDGEWLNDTMHGEGTLWYDKAENYVGTWVDGMQTGFGKYTTMFGSNYEGLRLKDKQNGFGSYTHPDGVTWSGEWINGVPANKNGPLHPLMKKSVADNKCTYHTTGNKPFYGQILYKCLLCNPGEEGKDGNFVCVVCWSECHQKRHISSGLTLESMIANGQIEQIWTLGRSHCGCHCSKQSHKHAR
jgi:hypothetical protein